MKYLGLLLILLMPCVSTATEVEGVKLADSLTVDARPLQLNGAGVRTKFFFDIYVGALYRREIVRKAEAVLAVPAPSVVTMDFLYKAVDAEKLRDGWVEGFRENLSAEAMRKLESRLAKFNSFFGNARRGDRYRFNFRTDGSTAVMFNGKLVGTVNGEDFQRALLAVWLGDRPADADLKRTMIGQ